MIFRTKKERDLSYEHVGEFSSLVVYIGCLHKISNDKVEALGQKKDFFIFGQFRVKDFSVQE